MAEPQPKDKQWVGRGTKPAAAGSLWVHLSSEPRSLSTSGLCTSPSLALSSSQPPIACTLPTVPKTFPFLLLRSREIQTGPGKKHPGAVRLPEHSRVEAGRSPIEVPHHVALHLGRRPSQHHGLRPSPFTLAAWLPLDVRVPQGCADVIEEPGQWAQLQEGFLEGQGCHLMIKCPVLKGTQRPWVEVL